MPGTAPPIHDGLFEIDDAGALHLVGGYSATSGQFHFPLLDTCPYTGATDVERVLLSRAATLWAWTAVTAAPPGYRGEVPFGFGIVELTKVRLRIVGRITEPEVDALTFGQPMHVVPATLPGEDGDVVTWAFAP